VAAVAKYRTSSGQTRYRVRYRTPEGRQTDKRGFATRRDAQLWAAQLDVSLARGEYVSSTLGRTTVGDLGPAWLARHRGHLKPSTYRKYEAAWRVHVEPRWADTPIGKIRRSDVQAWVTDLTDTISAAWAGGVHLVLLGILEDAVSDRMLASNPARNVKHKPRPPRRTTYLTSTQLLALAEQSRYPSLVLLLGIGGLRWAEAAALRVCDVDFLRRRVHLHRNAVEVGRQIIVGTLKTNQNRTVGLPAFVIEAIAATAAGKDRDELLWPRPSGGYQGRPNSIHSWFNAAVRRCQRDDPTFPRVTPHDLRHTAASLAIHGGANPKAVQRMLGHKSAAMTLDVYTDLFESDMDAVAENVGKMWARETGTS
jgi:integrase